MSNKKGFSPASKLVITLQYLSALHTILWLFLGLLTIMSIVLAPVSWLINTVLGLVFLGIACFFHFRNRAFIKLYRGSLIHEPSLHQASKSFLLLELALSLAFCLFSAFLLAMGIYRVFQEAFSVFG